MGLVFTYLLTFGGAAIALVRPFVGLLVYVAFSILKPDALWFWAVQPGNYSRIVAIAVLVGWSLRLFGEWRFERGRGVVLALGGYCLWATLSALFAFDEPLAWGFVWALARIALPFLMGMTLIDSIAKLKQLAWVIVLSEGFLALQFNRDYYAGLDTLHQFGFATLDNNSVAIGLVTCVALAFFLGLKSERWWQTGVAWGAALLMAHAVLFSLSRGGMMALGVTGAATFVLLDKRLKHFGIFVAAALVMLRLAGPEVRSRFFTTFAADEVRDASAASRTQLWTDCWDTMLEHPVLGVGPDNWPVVAPSYGWPPGKEGHTLWLQIGAELGVPGLALLAAFYGLCVARLWPIARGRVAVSDPWLRHLAQMVIASLVGFAVAAQFVSLEALETPYYVALIGAGALKLIATRERAVCRIPQETQFEWRPDAIDARPGQLTPLMIS